MFFLQFLFSMMAGKNGSKLDLYFEVFESISKGKKAFGTKELGEVMQSYGMKPSELELQVCFESIIFCLN